ncbi:PREDICTED: uncharacterized protein LOC106149059, partial [Chinchilla lanigera]|uniref:uncharacterized protein LOC106149059 n=1 Tax=Chinchilla lanigera TaxID=34839 RepID=UPI000696CE79
PRLLLLLKSYFARGGTGAEPGVTSPRGPGASEECGLGLGLGSPPPPPPARETRAGPAPRPAPRAFVPGSGTASAPPCCGARSLCRSLLPATLTLHASKPPCLSASAAAARESHQGFLASLAFGSELVGYTGLWCVRSRNCLAKMHSTKGLYSDEENSDLRRIWRKITLYYITAVRYLTVCAFSRSLKWHHHMPPWLASVVRPCSTYFLHLRKISQKEM